MSGLAAKEEASEALKAESLQAAAYQLERDRKAQEEKARCLVEEKALSEFLRCVAYGEQDKAETLLRAYPDLALRKGNLCDPAGREFKEITGFQYALWGLDWHMWRMLLKYMDKETAAVQFAELEEQGTAHGKYFKLVLLIASLATYTSKFNCWDSEQCRQYWCEQVGGSQSLLPVSVVNEYCHPNRSFIPLPTFKEESLPRSCQLFAEQGDWYRLKHGNGYYAREGISRYNWEEPKPWCPWNQSIRIPVRTYLNGDLNALRRLQEVRSLQLEALKLDLVCYQTEKGLEAYLPNAVLKLVLGYVG